MWEQAHEPYGQAHQTSPYGLRALPRRIRDVSVAACALAECRFIGLTVAERQKNARVILADHARLSQRRHVHRIGAAHHGPSPAHDCTLGSRDGTRSVSGHAIWKRDELTGGIRARPLVLEARGVGGRNINATLLVDL